MFGFRDKNKRATSFFMKGLDKYLQGRYGDAIKEFDKVIALVPDYIFGDAFARRGLCKQNLGHREEALKDYDIWVELSNQNAAAFDSRGRLKLDLGKYEEAIGDFDKVIESNHPGKVRALYGRGFAKYKLGRRDEAIKDYDSGFALNSHREGHDEDHIFSFLNKNDQRNPIYQNSAKMFLQEGISKAKNNKYIEAIADFDRAISLSTYDAELFYERGRAKVRIERYEESIKDFGRAIELDAYHIKALLYRCFSNQCLGRKEEASKDYDRAKSIDPVIADSFYSNTSNIDDSFFQFSR